MFTITFNGCYANQTRQFETIEAAHAFWAEEARAAAEENGRPDWLKNWLGARIQEVATGEEVARVYADGELEIVGG
jgi:hypothetical protein